MSKSARKAPKLRRYTPPTLAVYGTVAKLTAAGSAGVPEGGSTTSKIRP